MVVRRGDKRTPVQNGMGIHCDDASENTVEKTNVACNIAKSAARSGAELAAQIIARLGAHWVG
jgi:hypothetical protein